MQLATAVVSFALFIFLCVAMWAVLQSSNHKLVCESNAGRESVYIPRARISPPVLYMLLLRDKGSLCGNERAHYPHHNKTLMCLVWARGGTGEDNTSQTHSGTHTQALTQTCRACKHEHFSPNNTKHQHRGLLLASAPAEFWDDPAAGWHHRPRAIRPGRPDIKHHTSQEALNSKLIKTARRDRNWVRKLNRRTKIHKKH